MLQSACYGRCIDDTYKTYRRYEEVVEMTDQRVAIVTGGSRGIGRSIATTLAARGQAVVVGYAGSARAAADVVEEITAAGGKAVAAQADVADEHAVAAMFDTAQETFGGIDVVVNSAGRLSLSTIADLDLDDLDALHRTNVRGSFVVAREAARRVRDGARSSASRPPSSVCSCPPTAPTSPARAPSRG